VAAANIGRDGHPLGAISVSGLAERIPAARRAEFGLLIKRWCDGLSQQLGYAGMSRSAGGATR